MSPRRGRPVVAGLLSLLLPGAGQLYAGAWRRGVALFVATVAVAAVAAALVAARPLDLALSVTSRPLLAVLLLANVAVLGLRLFAVVDAWRGCAGGASALAVAGLAAVAAVAALPHVAAAYVAVRGNDVLEGVFAHDEPGDVLPSDGVFLTHGPQPPQPPPPAPARKPRARPKPPPPLPDAPLAASRRVLVETGLASEHPWVTILLIGSDHGPGQLGDRTDTMIVAALQRETRRAVAFGVPRNLVEVPLGGRAGEEVRRFHEPLNALYTFARTRPELFPGGDDAGATALKQTISRLLGIRIDYYAMVNLDGFVDVVDALGGVTIHVKERLVDELTKPTKRETKPRIDVHPGRTYHFYGRTALAYVRSRKASNDYMRMARQRCLLSALADQLDARSVLRNFRSLARTVDESVRTDVPLDRVPDLVRLATAVDQRQTLTATLGIEYFRGRRADRFPLPNVGKIRAAVRDAIFDPEGATERRRIASVAQAC